VSLPGTPADHLDALLRFLLPTAQRLVDEQGGFHPFGASMSPDGELRMLESEDGSGDEQLAALRLHAAAQADDLLAVGICADVTLEGRDVFPEAIRIELEHRDASPTTCLVAYRNTDEELTFADAVTLEGERRTWS
jgi:hypothetical protein